MSPFPHVYRATITRDAASIARLEAPPRPAITGGPPPEFGGSAETWSPEHLLLASLGLCFYTTFEALAQRDHLELRRWTSTVEATLTKTAGGLAFVNYRIALELDVAAADVERARAVVARAERHCIVTNALRAPVLVDARITAA